MHTKQTLEALLRNTMHIPQLYIFQDGIGINTNIDNWNVVGEIIGNISY